MNKIYKVWFDQINQEVYDIKARDEDEARTKAEKEWRKAHRYHFSSYVEEQKAE